MKNRKIEDIGEESACFVVAEIGNSHEGSIGLAKRFIKAAADCGVDAVKLQTHIFEAESLADAPNPPYFKDESRKEYLERTAFNLGQYKKLKSYAEQQCGVQFLSSPFSLEAVDLLEKVDLSAYKVPSGEVNNIPLLIKLAKTGKKVILSSGMSSWAELDEAVDTLRQNGCEDIVLMQCSSEYPCRAEDAGLNVMLEMRERYNLPVGFSDHTLGIAIAIAAAALGASIVEKHFTLSRKMYGSDAKNSTTPEEFKALVDGIRDVEKVLLNKVDKDEKAKSLKDMKRIFEKSIVAACDITAGTVIEERHLAYKKPGDGIAAREFANVLGKRSLTDIKRNQQIKYESLSKD